MFSLIRSSPYKNGYHASGMSLDIVIYGAYGSLVYPKIIIAAA
jgi:hypothetical protein